MNLRFALFAFVVGCSPAKGVHTAAPSTTATAPSTTAPAPSAEIEAALAAPDRDAEDRKLDAGRKPAEMLAFFGVHRGAKVAELFAGRGYTTEILARVVGETGTVYAQNSKVVLSKFAEAPFSERLQKPVMKHVVRVDRELDDPLPPEAKELDAVLFVLNYHDSVWLGADRQKMNAAVFRALRSGGVYGIVDHSGRTGTGVSEANTLHRIEESALRKEVEAAGFKLAAEGKFLRNEGDTRDWNASPMQAGDKRGSSDRFVLKYVKP